MKISVLIPYSGRKDLLIELIKTLRPLNDLISDVIIVNDDKKTGFTKAVNEGIYSIIRNSDSDAIWLLNEDAKIENRVTLTSMIKDLEEDENIGIISSVIYDIDGNKDFLVFAGGGDPFVGSHISVLKSKLLENTKKRYKAHWVTFCSVLIRTDLIFEIGLLDPRFKNVASDSDYCIRARENYWEVMVEPLSVVGHREKGGFSRAANKIMTTSRKEIIETDMLELRMKYNGSRIQDIMMEKF